MQSPLRSELPQAEIPRPLPCVAGGNSSPAPLRLLSPANPFHWASPGSAHTLRHRCGLPLAGGNSSPAPLRLLSPANPFHWASPGSAHTLRHRCGLPLLGVAVRRVRRHLMCNSFSTSFRLMVKIRLTPCSFVDAKSASLGTPAGGNSSPAPLRLLSPANPFHWASPGSAHTLRHRCGLPLRLLSPANPFHWASPGSAHTLRHRCGLPLLGVAVRRVRRHLMCNSFSTSFRLIIRIRLTPCSCMVTP